MTTEEWWEMQDEKRRRQDAARREHIAALAEECADLARENRILWRALTMPRTYPCEHMEDRCPWGVLYDCLECAMAWRLAVAEHEVEENR